MGNAPLSRRKRASLLGGVMEVTALEEAFEEFKRDGGQPSIGQHLLLREVEELYIKREDIEIIPEEGTDVQTPTDIAAAEAQAEAGELSQTIEF